jgi:outer membrane scaffolding protein for murein synthesis (MipA/OmpV family)
LSGTRAALAALGAILLCADASAGKLLDYIRNYDLNNYALGLAVTNSESPYAGAENSTYGYPYLTSFRNAAFTRDWLLIDDGDVGVRWVGQNDWVLGLVARIDTGGFGNSDSAALDGLFARQWALEMGPLIGWRRWPIQLEYKLYTEVLSRHDGLTGELKFSWPTQYSWGYVVPYVKIRHQDSSYNDYYYGVSSAEATPTRPEYEPGASTSLVAQLRAGYALNERWLLTGYVQSEWLGSEIVDSPIVDKSQLWSVNLGLAYNADLFQPREYSGEIFEVPRFELRVSAFRNSISSSIVQRTDDGEITDEIDLENTLGLEDEATVWQLDATYRIGRYHQMELGYYELGRAATTTLESDLDTRGEVFDSGVVVNASSSARIAKIAYSYSLMSDAQKRLGVVAGVHITKVKTEISAPDTGQLVRANVSTPLPVIGLFGGISIGRKMQLEAKINFFRMDFDSYEGSLNYVYLGLQRSLGEYGSIGVGYNYYAMYLEARNEDLNGQLRLKHHGPLLFLGLNF